MSEHSIEELERQWKQATDKAKDAEKRANEARGRLWAAKFEATGFSGCIAEYSDRGKPVRFLPVRVSRWGSYIEGPMIKKDGTPGEVDRYCDPEKATNLGPYTPPA